MKVRLFEFFVVFLRVSLCNLSNLIAVTPTAQACLICYANKAECQTDLLTVCKGDGEASWVHQFCVSCAIQWIDSSKRHTGLSIAVCPLCQDQDNNKGNFESKVYVEIFRKVCFNT